MVSVKNVIYPFPHLTGGETKSKEVSYFLKLKVEFFCLVFLKSKHLKWTPGSKAK
jgi:hypothetical protein